MLKKDYDKLKKLKKSQETLQASLLQVAIEGNGPGVITKDGNKKDNMFLISFLSFILISGIVILL